MHWLVVHDVVLTPPAVPLAPMAPPEPLDPGPLFFHGKIEVIESTVRAIESTVETATGPLGLVLIFVYSFLIAFVLPLPSEVVLAPTFRPGGSLLGLPLALEIGLVMLVSGSGKAAGSVFAFQVGHQAKQSGPVIRLLRRSRFDVVELSERATVQLARKYGYAGLALALSVPGFPDTLSIYAFSVLEENYVKFALATFAGSVGRLAVTVVFIRGAFSVL